MRYTPLNLHTVENTSLERGPPGPHVLVYLNLDYNFILLESGASPRLGVMSHVPRKKSYDHNISPQGQRRVIGVDLLLIEPLCEELRDDIVYGSQSYRNKPRVQV
jgi:hypothetical protein